MKSDTLMKRRNTRTIGFNEAEYKLIVKQAKRLGVYPRQLIMMKVRGNEPNESTS